MTINGIVYYVDPTCGSLSSQTFVGGRGSLRVPRTFDKNLDDFKSEIIKFAGLKLSQRPKTSRECSSEDL